MTDKTIRINAKHLSEDSDEINSSEARASGEAFNMAGLCFSLGNINAGAYFAQCSFAAIAVLNIRRNMNEDAAQAAAEIVAGLSAIAYQQGIEAMARHPATAALISAEDRAEMLKGIEINMGVEINTAPSSEGAVDPGPITDSAGREINLATMKPVGNA